MEEHSFSFCDKMVQISIGYRIVWELCMAWQEQRQRNWSQICVKIQTLYGKIGWPWSNFKSVSDHWVFCWGQLSILFPDSLCASNFNPKLHWCLWNLRLERFVQLENIFNHFKFCFICTGLLSYQVMINAKNETLNIPDF